MKKKFEPLRLAVKRNGKTYTWPKNIRWVETPPTLTLKGKA